MKTYALLLTIPLVMATFGDLGDNGVGDAGAGDGGSPFGDPPANIFGAASAVCQTPVAAAALAAKATVCGVAVESSQGLRTFVNAGELLRHNCRRRGSPFFLVANTTCQAYAASAAALGIGPAP